LEAITAIIYDYQAHPAPPVMKPSMYELIILQDDIIPFARTSGTRFILLVSQQCGNNFF